MPPVRFPIVSMRRWPSVGWRFYAHPHDQWRWIGQPQRRGCPKSHAHRWVFKGSLVVWPMHFPTLLSGDWSEPPFRVAAPMDTLHPTWTRHYYYGGEWETLDSILYPFVSPLSSKWQMSWGFGSLFLFHPTLVLQYRWYQLSAFWRVLCECPLQ